MEPEEQNNEDYGGTNRHEPANAGNLADEDLLVSELDATQYAYTTRQAITFFSDHGFNLARRTVTNYCKHGLLECQKFQHDRTFQWKITKASLDNRIEALKKEGFVSAVAKELEPDDGTSRQMPARAGNLADDIVVTILKEQIDKKDDQIAKKDEQIATLLDRDMETNVLIRELQGILKLALPEARGQGAQKPEEVPIEPAQVYPEGQEPNNQAV